jgi:glycosyltransferase involved in cell wall biosynthesis
MESLAMAVPVVTADVGDRRYMLGDGESGVLVSPDDSQALAQGLLAVLQDRYTRARMADAALLQGERWYWDHLIEDFVRVYADIS